MIGLAPLILNLNYWAPKEDRWNNVKKNLDKKSRASRLEMQCKYIFHNL